MAVTWSQAKQDATLQLQLTQPIVQAGYVFKVSALGCSPTTLWKAQGGSKG
jgi:hypothetical protein